ncbi:hypothetical protein GQ43DRAFT_374941 [Delitschia confertaspora ATCC 74209]|uniref:60S ribosomal subunit assembly/export protein LOC1 n=1 Tax=Delitschia confertaspora ATCC 74209 TaxID=1513339 RepID=A0A9P4JP13_9PLEO|nr:hypothetical protein GQ43DRAFT_374941 [Delitschia confertaspora ATCC 74209]
MAPTKSSSKGKGKSSGGAKKGSKPKPTGSAPTGISKNQQKKMSLAKPGGAQKTKSVQDKRNDNKKKRRVYTEKELDIPKLNGIIPAGIAKPHGVKKGKKFVDDPASMMAIMSMVNAEKEGHIESKIMRARQLEEVREARRKEMEARSEDKKGKFEEVKESLKKKRKHKGSADKSDNAENEPPKDAKKKRVSFGGMDSSKDVKPKRKRVSFG